MIRNRFTLVVCLTSLLPGCAQPEPVQEVEVLTVATVDTLVSSESAAIAYAIDVDVAESGAIFAADLMANTVVRVDAEGGVTSFGRRGAGPEEFSGPFALRTEGATLFVLDRGNGRLKRMSHDGAVESLARTAPEAIRSPPYLLGDGGMLVPTGGADSSLVREFDADAELVRTVGVPVVEVDEATQAEPILEMIRAGEIPDRLRNEGVVAGNAAGDIWIALTAEGEVRRYGPDGALRWNTRIDEPEMAESLEEFFRRNREEATEGSFFPLRYLLDLEVVGDEVWVLLQTDVTDPAVVIGLGADGAVTRRIEVAGGGAAVSFAVHPNRESLVIFTYHDAQLLRARLHSDGVTP